MGIQILLQIDIVSSAWGNLKSKRFQSLRFMDVKNVRSAKS